MKSPMEPRRPWGCNGPVSGRFHCAQPCEDVQTQCPDETHVLQPPPACAGQRRGLGTADLVTQLSQSFDGHHIHSENT